MITIILIIIKKSNNNNDDNKISNIPKGPDIWVTKWIDFSNKYGLGYILNNGFFGVFLMIVQKLF